MRKLYYVPGLISLIGLPVLLIFFGPEDFAYQYCCQIFLPREKRDLSKEADYSKDYVYQTIRDKKVVSIDLDDGREGTGGFYGPDPSSYMCQRKYSFITLAIEMLQFTNDTNSVLKIRIGESNTYGDFIWVLDNIALYNVRRYTFMDNNFILFSNNPIDHSPQNEMPAMPVYYSNWKRPSKWDTFKRDFLWEFRELQILVKRNNGYLIGFVLLIVVPGIIVMRKRKMLG